MQSEWHIEKFYRQIRKCPTCGSREGFWINYGLSNSYVQCKSCGVKTQFYHMYLLQERQAEKGVKDWKSTVGLAVGVVGLALLALGLIFGAIEAFPFTWTIVTFFAIIIFAMGLILTALTETAASPTTEKTLATTHP